MVGTEKKVFAESDLQRIKKIVFQISYNVDIDLQRINVPQKDLESVKENSLVKRLVNEYGFTIQSTIA